MNSEREKFVQGLKDLADWYARHEDIPLPTKNNATVKIFALQSRQDAAKALRALTPCEKEYAPDFDLLTIKRSFGGMELQFIFRQSDVCVRKVVGKRVIPTQIIPAQPERTIPQQEVEIVEWDCGPILSREKEAA